MKIGTFQPKGYYLIGARSGMGKTAFLLCMVRAAAKSGKKALVFSLEMPSKHQGSLATRFLSQETQIEHDKIRFAKYDDRDLKLMNQQAREPYMNNIVIYDKAEMTVLQMQSVIRRVKPDIVYIDYLGLIKGQKAEKREIEVSNISRDLRNTAKTCNVPMVTLVQLNRDTDTAKGKGAKPGRPALANISDSDTIHRDADVIMLLYREAQYNSGVDDNKAELIIAKNRQGKTGIISLSWVGPTMTFGGVFSDGEYPARPPRQPELKQQYDDVEAV
jgi:replicative DNA helicase